GPLGAACGFDGFDGVSAGLGLVGSLMGRILLASGCGISTASPSGARSPFLQSPVRSRTLVRPVTPRISAPASGTAGALSTGMRRAPGRLDTSEGRSFVRDRLALEGKMMFLLGGIFWLATTLLDSGLGIMKLADRLLWRPSVFHVLGVLAMGLLWLV